MTGGTHSQGAYGQMILKAGASSGGNHDFTSGARIAVEFLSETMRKRRRIIGGRGIRGTLSAASERTREGASFHAGEINMYCSAQLFHDLMSTAANEPTQGIDMYGMTESPSNTFTVSDTLPYFGMLIDRDEGVVEFIDCKLDYWMLRSRAPYYRERGEPDMLYLTLGIIASDEDVTSTWPGVGFRPALSTSAPSTPYSFSDSSYDTGVTLFGSERDVEEFIIRVSHQLKAKYTNSLTPHSLRPRDRIVQARFKVPWDSTNTDMYPTDVTGEAASIKVGHTAGAYSTKFAMENFQVEDESPVIQAKDQIALILDGTARSSGTTKELIVTSVGT